MSKQPGRRAPYQPCAHCGRLLDTRKQGLGANGRWLCLECAKDEQVVDQFFDDAFKPVGALLDTLRGKVVKP